MMAKPDTKGLVSGSSTVKVSLYGRLNPAIRYAATESMSSLQALDNSHSSSRFGINAGGAINKSMTASAKIEVGVNGPNRPGSGFDISGSKPAVGLRIAEASIGHKDMGTVTIGHGWRAGSGGFGANFIGTQHVFMIWGPGGDGIMATMDGKEVGKRHGAGPIYAFGAREARIKYNTPSLMGVGLEGSYNQDKGWSTGASFSGFPNMKEVSIALNAAYHSNGEDGQSKGFGVSGSLRHNASGMIATGMYGKQDDNTAWMVEGGWTGKVNDAGATSLTVGYGRWGDGISESVRYHFAINQAIASAGSSVYFGVSYDTGTATGEVMPAVEAVMGEAAMPAYITARPTDPTFAAPGEGSFRTAYTVNTEATWDHDSNAATAEVPIPALADGTTIVTADLVAHAGATDLTTTRLALFDPDGTTASTSLPTTHTFTYNAATDGVDAVEAKDAVMGAVERDGVITIIAGVLIKF